jgi:RNA polymerase sigma factor (TIGR02999 family)
VGVATPPSAVNEGVSALLSRARKGDARAGEELFATLYDDLRRVARVAMQHEPAGQTLEPTALVHEVFLRLTRRPLPWVDRRHFFAVAALAMRRMLVDHARSRGRRRRDPAAPSVDSIFIEYENRAIDLLSLDDALRKLEADDERAARVVELRFFGGLSLPHVARTLGVPLRTVERDWQWARAFLHARLS